MGGWIDLWVWNRWMDNELVNEWRMDGWMKDRLMNMNRWMMAGWLDEWMIDNKWITEGMKDR